MRTQTFMLIGLLIMVMVGCKVLDPPKKKMVNPKTGEVKWVETGEKSPAEEWGLILGGLGIPILTMAGAGLRMAAKARRLQKATVHATEIAIANGSLASARTDVELKAALKSAQTMVGDAELMAKYFKSSKFKEIKDKVKGLIPASVTNMLPGSSVK